MTEQPTSPNSDQEKPDSGDGLLRQDVNSEELSDLQQHMVQVNAEAQARPEKPKEGGRARIARLINRAAAMGGNILQTVQEYASRRSSVTVPTDIGQYDVDTLPVDESSALKPIVEPTASQTHDKNDNTQSSRTELVGPRFDSLRKLGSRVRKSVASGGWILQEYPDRVALVDKERQARRDRTQDQEAKADVNSVVLDVNSTNDAELSEQNALSQIQKAILEVINEASSINYGVTVVNPEDTLHSVLIDDEDRLEMVLRKLGIDHLDFILTGDATVANLVTSVEDMWKAQNKTKTPDKEEQKIVQATGENSNSKKPENAKAEYERLKAELIALDAEYQATPSQNNPERDKLEAQMKVITERLKEIDSARETTGRFRDRVHWQPIALMGSQILARLGIRAGLVSVVGISVAPAAMIAAEVLAVANVGLQVRKEESRLKEEGVETGLHRRALYDVTTRDRAESKDLKGWRKGVDTLGWALDLPTNQLVQLAANISRDRRQANRIVSEIDRVGADNWFDRVSENEVKRFARYLTRLRMMGYGRIDLKNRDSREADATKFEDKHKQIDQLVELKLTDPNLASKKKYEIWQKNGSFDESKLNYDAKGQYLKMVVAVAAGKLTTAGAGSMLGMFLGDVAHNVADGQNLVHAVGSTAHEAGQHVQQVAEQGGQVLKGVAHDVDAATGVGRFVDQAGDQLRQTAGQIQTEVTQAGGSLGHELGDKVDQLRDIPHPPVSPALNEQPPVVTPVVRTPVDWANLSHQDATVLSPSEQPQLTATDKIKQTLEQMRQTGAQAQEAAKHGAATAGVGHDALVSDSGIGTDDIPSSHNMLNDAKEVLGKVKDHLATLGYSHGVEHTFQVTGGQSPEQIADQLNATFQTTESGIFADGISYSSEAANSLDIAIASGRDAFTKPEIYDLFMKQLTETFHVLPGEQMVGYQDLIDHPEIRATFNQLVFAPGKEAIIPKIVHRLAAPGTYAALHNLKPR